MSQWWQIHLAVILCCVKLMEGYIFMTCATFHAVLSWESNVCAEAAGRDSDIYLELILWCTGQSDLTVQHLACFQATSHDFPPGLAPWWPSVRLGTFWKCCCCSEVTLHPCGDTRQSTGFLVPVQFSRAICVHVLGKESRWEGNTVVLQQGLLSNRLISEPCYSLPCYPVSKAQ